MKAVLAAPFLLSAFALAGDLNPPPGPVAETMKTLVEVEPRIAINAENTPGDATATFRITQSGSYYLTERFDSSDGLDGILVLANNVTIDLNGFDIFGDTDGEPGSPSANGIDASLADGVWIRNGRIWNFNGRASSRGTGRAWRTSNRGTARVTASPWGTTPRSSAAPRSARAASGSGRRPACCTNRA